MTKRPDSSATGHGFRSVRLGYGFGGPAQSGAQMDQSLFAVLAAVRDHGSIGQAAKALDRSYRFVWGSLRQWESELGEPLVSWTQGQAARLTDFAERLLWAEMRARKRMQPHIEALRADLEKVLQEARDGRHQLLRICASHDLALPQLREHAAGLGLDVDLHFQGSIDAVRSLNSGRCLLAGFHVPALRGAAPGFAAALKPLLRPGVHKLIGCSRRTQGLMMRKEHAQAVRGVGDLAGTALRFVNRQTGSGTRLLMDHLLRAQALSARDIDGYESCVEESHVAVAACVASGVADVGPGVEAAALEFGLHFVPLVEEDYFLACLKQNLRHPAVLQLCELLAGRAWGCVLLSLPGYAPARSPGRVLAMASELPWWQFGRPKLKSAAGASGEHAAKVTDTE